MKSSWPMISTGEYLYAGARITHHMSRITASSPKRPHCSNCSIRRPVEPRLTRLPATRTSNAVQLLVYVVTDRRPPYPQSQPEDDHGLQSSVVTLIRSMTRGNDVRRSAS